MGENMYGCGRDHDDEPYDRAENVPATTVTLAAWARAEAARAILSTNVGASLTDSALRERIHTVAALIIG